MKLDDKIRNRRIAYLLTREVSTAFEIALLYFVLAKRRSSEDKIAEACLKSCQWLQRAGIQAPAELTQIEPAERLYAIEKILTQNKGMICQGAALVHAIPTDNRDIGFAYVR